jgi:FixJ family two-component response regulator
LGFQLRILIADDHEIVRAGMRSILLLRSGVQIFESCNGQEALEQARKANPDVIILDITMPVMTGDADNDIFLTLAGWISFCGNVPSPFEPGKMLAQWELNH